MTIAHRLTVTACMFLSIFLPAQDELKMSISLLGQDLIAEVNIDQDPFVKGIGQVTELTSQEFKHLPEDQKLALLMVVHKQGKVDFEVHATPALSPEKEKAYLQALRRVVIPNTKLVDFPLLLLVHADIEHLSDDFKQLVLPSEKRREAYQKAPLVEKLALCKTYACEEVLPVLSAFEVIVDEKFGGVKGFGTAVQQKDFKKTQNADALTGRNPDYWQACMEMSVGNQLIPATKIAMLVSQGELDHASKYLEMMQLVASPKSAATTYLNEMSWRLEAFSKDLQLEINKGIEEHDHGNYEKAIAIYRSILASYPNSAAAKYELFFSQNALDLKKGSVTTDSRMLWDKSKPSIYQSNPLYPMDVRASNGREMYLLSRRQAIQQLFKDDKEVLHDLYAYADIALDLGVYDFAAQLFWLSITYDDAREDAIVRYFYCLEKLGVKKLKDNFKGDFDKKFAELEQQKQQEMENDSMSQSFDKK